MIRDEDAPDTHPPEAQSASTDMMARFSRGEPEAVATLYGAHADVVARVAARLGAGSKEDVEDIVQTTFLEAIKSASRFLGTSTVRSWLIGIAANQTRALRRTEGRARKRIALVAATPVEPAALAEQVLVEASDLAGLRVALAKLPEMQREALVLCELEGLSAREVSLIVGAPPATIWRRVHDAKVSLRRLLVEKP